MQAGQAVAKGLGQMQKAGPALGTGGFGRLMQQGMPNTAEAASYGIDPMNPRFRGVDPGPNFGYPEDVGQYGGQGPRPGIGAYNPMQMGAPFIQRPAEDDANVYGPRGMQPLNQMRRNEPWQNASGPFNR